MGWLLVLAAAVGIAAADAAPVTRTGHLNVVTIRGSINPASSDYLQKAIAESETDGAAALLLELDTPGGLVASTKDIIQAMLNARVPVIVYVAPRGAWAGSAGTFITIAANVAAMAPGSSIGAAHPVGIGGGKPSDDDEGGSADPGAQKAENLLAAFIESIAEERERNVEWAAKAVRESVAVTADKALELDVIDIVAATRSDLLTQLREHPFPFQGEMVVLDVADSRQRLISMDTLTRVLNVIVDPNVAVLLLMAGLLGLYIEFNQPGTVVPGVVGAACLLLALIAMQILPFSWIGLLLIACGIALFITEIFVTSYGLLFAGGVICFLIGGSMVFDRPDLSDLNVSFWPVLVPTVAGLALFGGLVVYAVGRTLGRRQESGVSELIGMTGVATTALEPTGKVFIRGEYWTARADEPIAAEERVEATAVEGMELRVRRAGPLG